MSNYPDIPAEGEYSEAEMAFIENSPPGLWPDNQDSYFGQFRKVVTDQAQILRDLFYSLWLNMVPQTADIYLDRWEKMVGLPVNPAGKTIRARRVAVLARLQRGAFTRAKRDRIINEYISLSVDGDPAKFTPEGITFVGGIPLYPEYVANLTQKFQVLEWVQNFYYRVLIATGYIGDVAGLERELRWLTPAGITFTIDDTRSIPASFYYQAIHSDPQALWVMRETSGTDAADEQFNRTPGVFVGSPTLNNRALSGSDGGLQPLFDGTNDTVSIAHTSWLDVGDKFTIIVLVYPTEARDETLWSMGHGGPQLQIMTDRSVQATKENFTVLRATAAAKVPLNAITMIAYSKDGTGTPGKIWINGIEDTSGGINNAASMLTPGAGAYIGSREGATEWFKGNIGYPVIYGRELSASEMYRLNRARLGLLP